MKRSITKTANYVWLLLCLLLPESLEASEFIIYETMQVEDITGFLYDPILNESFLTEEKHSGKDDYYGGGESGDAVNNSLDDPSRGMLFFLFLFYTLYIIRYKKCKKNARS